VPLEFRREDREAVAAGEITVTYRLWKSARVKAGKTYPTSVGPVLVEAVDLRPAVLIDGSDLPLAGCRSLEDVWRSAGEHTKTQVGPDTLLYRVQFRIVS
jgi:hypothetical protein